MRLGPFLVALLISLSIWFCLFAAVSWVVFG